MFKCFFITKEAFWVEVKCRQMREQRSSCLELDNYLSGVCALLRAWFHAGTGLSSCTESTWIPSPLLPCLDSFHLCWQHQRILGERRDGRKHDAKKKKGDFGAGNKSLGGMGTNPCEIKIPFRDQQSRTGGNNMCFYFVVFQINWKIIK